LPSKNKTKEQADRELGTTI